MSSDLTEDQHREMSLDEVIEGGYWSPPGQWFDGRNWPIGEADALRRIWLELRRIANHFEGITDDKQLSPYYREDFD